MQYTIQDIFELRKKGLVEEAYNAVLPMYSEHHGHYTTIAMFWTAIDMARLVYDRGERMKAGRIFASLQNLYPSLADKDKRGQDSIDSLADYIGMPVDNDGYYDVDKYLNSDWNWSPTDDVYVDEADGEVYQLDDYYLIRGRKSGGRVADYYVQAEELTHAQEIIQDYVADLTAAGYDVEVIFNGLPEDLEEDLYVEEDPVYIEEDRQTSLFAPEPDPEPLRRIRENDGQLLLFEDDQLRTM